MGLENHFLIQTYLECVRIFPKEIYQNDIHALPDWVSDIKAVDQSVANLQKSCMDKNFACDGDPTNVFSPKTTTRCLFSALKVAEKLVCLRTTSFSNAAQLEYAPRTSLADYVPDELLKWR